MRERCVGWKGGWAGRRRRGTGTPACDFCMSHQRWAQARVPVSLPLNRQIKYSLLYEVLCWVRDNQCMALVALKKPQPGTEVKVLKEIDRAKVHHLTRVVAHSLPGLRRLRQLDPKIHLGLYIAERPPVIREAQGLGAAS